MSFLVSPVFSHFFISNNSSLPDSFLLGYSILGGGYFYEGSVGICLNIFCRAWVAVRVVIVFFLFMVSPLPSAVFLCHSSSSCCRLLQRYIYHMFFLELSGLFPSVLSVGWGNFICGIMVFRVLVVLTVHRYILGSSNCNCGLLQ